MIDTVLRPELETPPSRIASLPVYRGYPVPWFVAWIDGVPEFRAADGEKFASAVRRSLCWVCGDYLGRHKVFVLGPMCGINRTTSEPPCHLECARYSARNCPFLARPHMIRRENDLPEGCTNAGDMIRRNPGVTLLWTTLGHRLFGDGRGGILFDVGEPAATEWYAGGSVATRAQVEHSVDTGLPLLLEMAQKQGPAAVADLLARRLWLETIYPR